MEKENERVYKLPDTKDVQELRAFCLDLAVKSIGEQSSMGFSRESSYLLRAKIFENYILSGEINN